MEDLIASVVRDLPSTAVLILFVWFTSKQFQQAITLLSEHLKELDKLLELGMRSAHLNEKEKEIDRKLHMLSDVLTEINMTIKRKDN